ncbi:hypothetical protein MPLSOD_40080 [Mesorhizobium sp. SOD10]|nr:hypothetical protein MPLSOD_40080 [Mesorhizobium sp. SOD10]
MAQAVRLNRGAFDTARSRNLARMTSGMRTKALRDFPKFFNAVPLSAVEDGCHGAMGSHGLSPLAQLRVHLDLAGKRDRGVYIGLLPGDAPIFELVEWDVLARHRAAHEGAGTGDLEVAVEIADPGFPAARAFETVHHERTLAFIGFQSPQIAGNVKLDAMLMQYGSSAKMVSGSRHGHLLDPLEHADR